MKKEAVFSGLILILIIFWTIVFVSHTNTTHLRANATNNTDTHMNVTTVRSKTTTISNATNNTDTHMNATTWHKHCQNETMIKRHERVLTTCTDGTGSFIGEKNHKLWWDESQQHWFCGMNTSNISLVESGIVKLPLKFDPFFATTPPLHNITAYLRDGTETTHYRSRHIVVIAIQGNPPGTLAPEILGVPKYKGVSVDINFTFGTV